MAADIKWIKITTDIFDDEKIRLIEGMPERDTLVVIWFKLLTMAGRTNDNGSIYISKKMPTTDEMLATIFNRPLNTIRMALSTFESFGMIEINDHIEIVNWKKHQNIDGMEKIRKQNAERQKKFKEKKKELFIENKESNVTVTFDNATDKDKIKIRLDKEKDKMIDNDLDIEKEQTNQSISNYIKLVSEATETNLFQVQQVINLATLRNYDINLLILKIKESKFLMGKSDVKPTIRNFTQSKMLNYILADSYKDNVKTKNADTGIVNKFKKFENTTYNQTKDEKDIELDRMMEGW